MVSWKRSDGPCFTVSKSLDRSLPLMQQHEEEEGGGEDDMQARLHKHSLLRHHGAHGEQKQQALTGGVKH